MKRLEILVLFFAPYGGRAREFIRLPLREKGSAVLVGDYLGSVSGDRIPVLVPPGVRVSSTYQAASLASWSPLISG